jgi:type IV secretory pathway VirD2 relaxase
MSLQFACILEHSVMAADDFEPKLGRIREPKGRGNLRTTKRILQQASKAGAGTVRQRGHILPGTRRRGMAPGVLARAGLIAPGSRRVIVRARYSRQRAGDVGAARAHLRYIQRDGTTRAGEPGRLYDAHGDDPDAGAFLERSENDPHQFRFIVSAEDSPRLRDLKPFVRDLMRQMEQDLDTKLDWVAVDHFNTGHPHTHIVIRGRDDQGRDLVMAHDYIGHGVRARAQSLVTLELGPESEVERLQKLMNEVGQERLTRLDRSLLGHAKDNILVVTSADERDPARQTMRIGRLKTLERLGLASERQPGVWSLDAELEPKLRRLGERADTYKMMQRALADAGIDRGGAQLALFERGRRQAPVAGKVIAVGLVDEITDRHYVIVDGADGRVHYAELGRLRPHEVPSRGMVVSLASDSLHGKPKSTPRVKVLSPVELEALPSYDGPTWLDRALTNKERLSVAVTGFGGALENALDQRRRWLLDNQLAEHRPSGDWSPKPGMTEALHQREQARIVQVLSRQLNATYIPHEPGSRISGVYERAFTTPNGRLAVIRREDTYTLAPWKAALEPMRGQAVTALIGPNRVSWSLDRGRGLPGRG